MRQKLRAANIALSRTVLTPAVLSPYLPAFIATLTYSIWHGRSFPEMSANPTPGLKQFARFTMDILRATGLSFSVVLLALKYVHRIKTRRPELMGAEGSECRLLVCTLMLSMKYLMDNTYSNKTWHKVSRIPLLEINVTEMEFLAQLNFDLHVEEEDSFDWLAFIEHAVVEFRRITSEAQRQQQKQAQQQQQQQQQVHQQAHIQMHHHQVQQAQQQQQQAQQQAQQQQQPPYPSPGASPIDEQQNQHQHQQQQRASWSRPAPPALAYAHAQHARSH